MRSWGDRDGRQFARGRDFAAWAGMTPRQHSSAGKRRAPGLSRQGEGRLRKLFALGATTLMRNARLRQDRATVWQRGLMARRQMKVAIIAQAAKTARIAWRSFPPESLTRPASKPRLKAGRADKVSVSFERSKGSCARSREASDGKMVRTWVGTIRFVIAPSERVAMLGNPIRDAHRGQRS